MLRPEKRKDRKLEMARLTLEQFADTVELPVGQAENTMDEPLMSICR
jgi:hypothetical protein